MRWVATRTVVTNWSCQHLKTAKLDFSDLSTCADPGCWRRSVARSAEYYLGAVAGATRSYGAGAALLVPTGFAANLVTHESG